jgi:hypothetical protein
LRTSGYALVGIGSSLLVLGLFLPWYSGQTGIVCVTTPCPSSESVSGWEAFASTDAVLLAIAAASLGCLLLLRATDVAARPR